MKKKLCICRYYSSRFDVKKSTTFISNLKDVTRWLPKDKQRYSFCSTRWTGYGALAQVIGKTAIPFSRKYVVPAAKHVGADLMELPAPKVAEVVCGRKTFKNAVKFVERQTSRNWLDSGS